MEFLLYLFISIFSSNISTEANIDSNKKKDSYETTYDVNGRITFKAKEGATLA